MTEVNVRIGKEPHSGRFISTVNLIDKPLEETFYMVMDMRDAGVGNKVKIDGEVLCVKKIIIEDDRIIAEARSE